MTPIRWPARGRCQSWQRRNGRYAIIAIIAIIAINWFGGHPLSNLIVRNIDETIVQSLKERAVRHGRSMEAEHRALLAEALFKPRRRSLAEVLAAMPNVGDDADFARVHADKAPRVFD